MLVTSIFSSSNNVFYPSHIKFYFLIHIYVVVWKCFQFGLSPKILSFGKELNNWNTVVTVLKTQTNKNHNYVSWQTKWVFNPFQNQEF